MKLSILIITYNQQKYIHKCLESVLLQNVPFSHEILISDDFSTDLTVSCAEQILNQNSKKNYRIIKNSQNVGISQNYKRGFKECSGEFIAVIEGDDYWTDPLRIQKHITFLESHKECVFSFNRMELYYEETGSIEIPEWNLLSDYEYITTRRLAEGNCIGNMSACVFRRSFIEKLTPDLFDIEIADWMIGMALGRFGPIAYLKEVMSVYVINSNGKWSKKTSEERLNEIIRLIDIYNRYLGYSYNNEFSSYKLGLINKKRKLAFHRMYRKFFPPGLSSFIRRFIPLEFRRSINKVI